MTESGCNSRRDVGISRRDVTETCKNDVATCGVTSRRDRGLCKFTSRRDRGVYKLTSRRENTRRDVAEGC